FSSRRRHTRWPRDWSSDVCSSDLEDEDEIGQAKEEQFEGVKGLGDPDRRVVKLMMITVQRSIQPAVVQRPVDPVGRGLRENDQRSEERRVGKESRSGGWPDHEKKI